VSGAAPFSLAATDWWQDQAAIRAVRTAVFVQEQAIPAALEWDEHDAACRHVLARDATGNAIGTGRLRADGRIGHMAVLRHWRGRGAGKAMLDVLLGLATAQGLPRVYLHAQAGARDFYRNAGFRQQGEWFEEAGIPHLLMTRATG